MAQKLNLGVLDLCRTAPQFSSKDAIWWSVDAAPVLEALGYSRYWLAEHHEYGIAHGCPEIMATIIAGLTTRMRVGTAGVLLRYYSALKVAKTFRLLAALYPDRIDLGIAGGQASLPDTDRMLLASSHEEQTYEHKAHTLITLLHGKGEVQFTPSGTAKDPRVWVLGTGVRSAQLAAKSGAALCIGLSSKESKSDPKATAIAYRQLYPHHDHVMPAQLAIAVGGSCAETSAAAASAVSAPAQFAATLVGTPTSCSRQIRELCDSFETNDVIFIELAQSGADRMSSLTLLSQALALKPPIEDP